MLKPNHIEALEKRGLDIEMLTAHGVESCSRLGGDAISIPFLEGGAVVNHKYRTLGDEKKFAQDEHAPKIFWNVDCLRDRGLDEYPVIITEGEFDALSAIQAGFPRTMSVPDGAPAQELGESGDTKYSYVKLSDFDGVDEIILATDGDGPGANLLNDLAVRLGKGRCKWLRYPRGCKDLNDALVTYGLAGVQETIRRAQWVFVPGVRKMSELPPLTPPEPKIIGIDGLEDHWRICLGYFTVISGYPGDGKSTFINDVACHLAERHSWKTAFASFEQQPQTDHRRALVSWRAREMAHKLTTDELTDADKWIDDNFVFITADEDETPDLFWLLDMIKVAIMRHGVKLIVIDPWNELDHIRDRGQSMTEYVGEAIKAFRRMARKFQVHIIVAAHPSKMRRAQADGKIPKVHLNDISDSAHWWNKSDTGIVVSRDGIDSLIEIQKSRYFTLFGKPGEVRMRFSPRDQRFRVVDENPTLQAVDDLEADELPL